MLPVARASLMDNEIPGDRVNLLDFPVPRWHAGDGHLRDPRQTGDTGHRPVVRTGMNRHVVVVDEDVDPSNLDEAVWAMSTRSDPAGDVEILLLHQAIPGSRCCVNRSRTGRFPIRRR